MRRFKTWWLPIEKVFLTTLQLSDIAETGISAHVRNIDTEREVQRISVLLPDFYSVILL